MNHLSWAPRQQDGGEEKQGKQAAEAEGGGNPARHREMEWQKEEGALRVCGCPDWQQSWGKGDGRTRRARQCQPREHPGGAAGSVWAVPARWAERAGQVEAQAEPRCARASSGAGPGERAADQKLSRRSRLAFNLFQRRVRPRDTVTRWPAGRDGAWGMSPWPAAAGTGRGGLKPPELGGSGSAVPGAGPEQGWQQ